MDFEGCDIVKLAELLNSKKEFDSDSEDSCTEELNNKREPLPSDVGKKPKQSIYTKVPSKNDKKFDPLNSESEDALYFSDETTAISDWRKTPEWEVSYKQQVTTSDVFLQMGLKSPASSSCEDMILKVHLPNEDFHNIDLKTTETAINLVSPKYKLEVPLPHPVDPQRGSAQWDKESEKLIITLRMNREFDFINF